MEGETESARLGVVTCTLYFYVVSESSLFGHPMLVRAHATISSQPLPMVDGGWIVLEGPNIICVG